MKNAMELAGMKQSELCEKTGIGKSSISQYLSGDYEPKQKNIYKIATALNISPAYLLGFTNDPKNYATLDLIDEEPSTTSNQLLLPPLTPKDERQIAKDLEAMLNSLDDKNGIAAFNSPEDEEDREALKASLLASMIQAKKIAKKKFTPKKYRKEWIWVDIKRIVEKLIRKYNTNNPFTMAKYLKNKKKRDDNKCQKYAASWEWL